MLLCPILTGQLRPRRQGKMLTVYDGVYAVLAAVLITYHRSARYDKVEGNE